MPFRFSLDEVLEHRKRLEEMRLREMSIVQREVDYVEGLLDQARERRAYYRRERGRSMERGEAFARQELFLNYLFGLERLIDKTNDHLLGLRRELERRRERLNEAARDRQVLEELEKVERRRFLLEERRAEDREYDEIAIRNFARGEREKSSGEAEGTVP